MNTEETHIPNSQAQTNSITAGNPFATMGDPEEDDATGVKQGVDLVLLSAGSSNQSTTWRLLELLGEQARKALEERGRKVRFHTIHLSDLAAEVATSITTGRPTEGLQSSVDKVGEADGLIVGTPVYKASYSGLLKSFLDVLDDDILLSTPTLLSATGGTPRHGLVPDVEMRTLFAYFRALTIPTAVYAATEDWADPKAMGERIARAAEELGVAMDLDVRGATLQATGKRYRRTFDPRANTEDPAEGLDFDSDLMKLAAGGQ